MVREKILLIWFFKSTGWKIKRKWGEKMRNRKSWRMTNDWLLVPISTRWTLWGILIVLKSITTIFFYNFGMIVHFFFYNLTFLFVIWEIFPEKMQEYIHPPHGTNQANLRVRIMRSAGLWRMPKNNSGVILGEFWFDVILLWRPCSLFYLCCFILEKILLANWECNIIVLWRPGLTCKEKRGVC